MFFSEPQNPKGEEHPRPQEQPLQRPGDGRQHPSQGPTGQHLLQSSSWGPPSMPRPVPSLPESCAEAGVALPGPPPPSFGGRAWKSEPDSGRGMGSSFVNGASCMTGPGTDGQTTPHPSPCGPRGRCTHTYTRLHVDQHGDTHDVEDSYPPLSCSGELPWLQRVLGLGGGRTGPTVALNLGQSLNQGRPFGFWEGL